ncbi:extracellular solute-binding protein [Candidatus Darwinibacter acetoxidans]
MKKRIFVLAFAAVLLLVMAAPSMAEVTIEYWQYYYESKVKLIDELIPVFEAQNPGIKVKHITFPYDAFNEQVAAAVAAGEGPDVLNIFYGWLPMYLKQGFLQPLPEKYFTVEQIEERFIPMVNAVKVDGQYWALPTAVRSLALFYNVDHFAEEGFTEPPKTWDELLEMAIKLTRRTDRGALVRQGYGWNVTGQDWHLFREVLLRQWGVAPLSEDNRTVTMNSDPAAYEVLEWWIDWSRKYGVGEEEGRGLYRDSFLAGRASMIVDGSFGIGTISANPNLKWAVAELPVKEIGGEKSNFGSFWAHAITRNATGEKLDAAAKFLEFITSDEVQRTWLERVGELPASRALAQDPALREDPVYGPFVRGLEYSHATFFVDETIERELIVEAVDKILLLDAPVKDTLDQLVNDLQKVRDEYFNSLEK